MNIRYIKNFIKLANYRNFSECARDLSISQSTLSHQISQIEEDFGNVKLIDRTTKKFEITEAGNIFLDFATQIIELYTNCELELEKFSKQKYEKITITASTIPGSHILPKLIAEYKSMNPSIIFNIKINNSKTSINKLIKNNADFAGIGSFMNYNSEQFESIIIGSEELKFICSLNHELLKRGQNTVSFNQLKKFPFIWRESGSGMRAIFQQQFPYYDKLNIKLEMNDNDSIISTVSDSEFISIMSEMMAEKSKKANLIATLNIKEYPTVAKRNLYFIKKKETGISDTKKDFWEFIKKKTK